MPTTLPRKLSPRPRKLDARPRKRREVTSGGGGPINIAAVSVMGAGLTLTFDQPVLLRGTPGITTDIAGAVAISAIRQAPNRIMIIYSASLAGARVLNLTYRDPAIRNGSGGYLTSNRFVFDV
jgi:hypothetical protein